MNRWQKQTLFVLRNEYGRIVGISETIPTQGTETTEKTLRKAYSASEDASKRITEYAKRKKRLWMGGD